MAMNIIKAVQDNMCVYIVWWLCLIPLMAAYFQPKKPTPRSIISLLRVQDQELDDDSDKIELCEFVSSSGETIIASVCMREHYGRNDVKERTRLEAFSQALLGMNLSSNSTIMVFKTLQSIN